VFIVDGLVMTIYQIIDDAYIVSHSCDSVDAGWISIYFALVSTSAANVMAVLVVHFNAVQPDIEEVAMSGVQV